MTPKEALDLSFYCNDLHDEVTIRSWLKELLITLWDEGEGFSGKRPFGNSGWEGSLEVVLIQNGCVAGEVTTDEDGTEVDDIDRKAYHQFVYDMIVAL